MHNRFQLIKQNYSNLKPNEIQLSSIWLKQLNNSWDIIHRFEVDHEQQYIVNHKL